MSESSNAAKEHRPEQPAAPQGLVIAVFGAKAGVGTSTVAVNLGLCAQQQRGRESVALVDLNLQSGDLHLLLGLEPMHRWREIMRESDRLDATLLMTLLAKHTSGLHLLASDYDGLGETMLKPDLVSRAMAHLRSLFPIVILDCGHVLQAPVRKALEQASTILIVTRLDIPSMRRAKRVLDVLRPLLAGTKKIHVLINSLDQNDRDLVEEAEKALGHRIAWQIPADFDQARSAIDEGRPLCTISPRKDVAKAYRNLALALTEEEPGETDHRPRGASGWRAKLLTLVKGHSP